MSMESPASDSHSLISVLLSCNCETLCQKYSDFHCPIVFARFFDLGHFVGFMDSRQVERDVDTHSGGV